jgi:hypothetical protein
MLLPNSSSGVKKTANRLIVLLFVIGVVVMQGHPAVKAQGRRRKAPAVAARASANSPTCEQSKANAEGRVKELQERVDNHLKEVERLQSRFASRGLSYDDWGRLSDVEKKKAITEAEQVAADVVLDYLTKGLVDIGDIGPIDAADFIKKHKISDPALINFLQRFALNNVYQYPTWAQKVEKAIDYLKAHHNVRDIADRRGQGETGLWDEYLKVIFDVFPYQIERYAFTMSPYKQAPMLEVAKALKKISSGWSLSKSISASWGSVFATYISLRNIATLTTLNERDLMALGKLDAVLKADVERLKQARLDLNKLGDCPDETEIVFTYSVLGGVAVPAVPGLDPDFVTALRNEERLRNAAQQTNDPTLRQFLLTAAAAMNKNNVRVSADPSYYVPLASRANELRKKIDELEAQSDALAAKGQVDAAFALKKAQEPLIIELNKVMDQASPQPSGPPSYVPMLGGARAGSTTPAKKGLARVTIVNNTGKGIAASFGTGSVRLAVGGRFTRQVTLGSYGLGASTTSPVGGRILRGSSTLTVEDGSHYEVSVALAKKGSAGEAEPRGLTTQVRARVVGAGPPSGSTPDQDNPNRTGTDSRTGPLYYVYDGGKLSSEGAGGTRDVRQPSSGGETTGPPPELLKPERDEDLREWLAKHPQFLKRVLSNNLPPELKNQAIELSDQEAPDRSRIPPGWVECTCPSDHPGLGIFLREGGRVRQFHDPNFHCP